MLVCSYPDKTFVWVVVQSYWPFIIRRTYAKYLRGLKRISDQDATDVFTQKTQVKLNFFKEFMKVECHFLGKKSWTLISYEKGRGIPIFFVGFWDGAIPILGWAFSHSNLLFRDSSHPWAPSHSTTLRLCSRFPLMNHVREKHWCRRPRTVSTARSFDYRDDPKKLRYHFAKRDWKI